MSHAEVKALVDAVDDEAEGFLTACVHLARFMQIEVRCEAAIPLLQQATAAMLEKLHYYEENLDEITNRISQNTSVNSRRGGIKID